VTAQELLDALEKARNASNLDHVAFLALSNYLRGAWKNSLARDLHAYDLGKALSDFFVDLSMLRLPEKITTQTQRTEQHLLEFYGVAGGGLSQFWTRCIQIWDITLEPYPTYAGEVKKYFGLLLQSSLQGKRVESAIAMIKPSNESFEEPRMMPVPALNTGGTAPEAANVPPVSPALTGYESSVEPPAPVAAVPIKQPEQADVPVPAGNEAGSVTPAMAPTPKNEMEPLPRNAYLVLQGTRVIPLNRSFIKIGRQLDNHIILEDPRVSRFHAQIKLVNDRFVIFDMNSTGGTFVNGRSTRQSVLFPGDVVSLAGVVFIFSQELPARPVNLKLLELGSPFAADRPTSVIQDEGIWAANKIGPKDLPDLPKTGPFE